ncbi:uncharacterized protein [Miscanthus floridulus]|uniref:uncharacterized protein isoform X1 n=1 Tax=Miscanthus floridulus TaxID=154761 RepID=UPI00345989D8
MAQSASMNEECANLLRRMDLEDSESDGESSKSEMAVDEKVISLGESVDNKEADHVEEIQEVGVLQDERVTQKKMMQSDGDLVTEQVKKRQKRKWGPILRIDRPKRVPKDGRTVMQKAQDFKEAGNTMKVRIKKGRTHCRELPLCAGSGEGCQWQALPTPVQCQETATRTRDLPVTGGSAVEWDEEGVCYSGKDAKKLVADVQTGGPGEDGAGESTGESRSKLSTVDQMEFGYIRVGSINCSAFGGLRKCVSLTT